MSLQEDESRQGTEHWPTVPSGQTDYISGRWALNLEDPASGDVADWHQSGWSARSGPDTRCDATKGSELATETTRVVWGTKGLFDARPALRELGHPAGSAKDTVLCASHVRAITEIAADDIGNGGDARRSVGADQVNRWIGTARQFIELHIRCSQIGRRLEGEQRTLWWLWQKTLHPRRRWDTEHSVWWPLGYGPAEPPPNPGEEKHGEGADGRSTTI